MAVSIGSLFASVTLSTKNLDKGIKRATRQLNKFSRDAKSVGKSISVGLGAPLVALGTTAVKSFADFEQAMLEVKSLLPDIAGEDFSELQQGVKDLSTTFGTDLIGNVNALYQAISAGVPQENALTFLEVASKAAIAGVTDTATAVDGLSTILNAFGLEATETEKVADMMFTAVKGGKTTFEELSSSIFQAASTSNSLGIGIDEVLTAVTELTKQGTPTSVAMTQIRAAISNLIKPTEEMAYAFDQLNATTAKDLISERGFLGALQAITEESGLTDQGLAKAFGSVEGYQAVLALTGENIRGATATLEEMRNSAGAMDEAFRTLSQSTQTEFDIIAQELKVLSVDIGETLTPAVRELTESFRAFFTENKEEFAQFATDNAEFATLALVIGGIITALGFLAGSISSIIGFLAILKTTFGAVIAFIAAHPLIALAIVAISGIIAVIMNWEKVCTDVEAAWDSLTTTIGETIDSMKEKVTGAFNAMIESIQALIDKLRELMGLGGGGGGMNPMSFFGSGMVGGGFGGFMASGGKVARGTTYMVGEEGPELFTPSRSGYIVPNDKISGADTSITMNFAPGTDMATVAALKNMKDYIADVAVGAVKDYNMRTA